MRAGSIFYPIAEIFGVGILCLVIPLGVMVFVCWWSRRNERTATVENGGGEASDWQQSSVLNVRHLTSSVSDPARSVNKI